MNKRPLFVRVSTVMILVFFAVFVILPLFSMFSTLAGTDVGEVLSSRAFRKALGTSLSSAALVTVFTLLLAFCDAWILCRVDVPLKPLWQAAVILPMLVPSVSLGNGLVALFGTNGFLTVLLKLPIAIYGLHGIVIGQVIYCLPPIFLLIYNLLRYEDYTPHEAALVLGVPRHLAVRTLTLPYARQTLISAALLVFTMSVTDYGIPFSVGGKLKTLSTVMFSEVAGQLKFGKGSVIGLCLLIPAVLAFLADSLLQGSSATTVTQKFPLRKDRSSKTFGTAVSFLISLTAALPIMAFMVMMLMDDYPLRMQFTLQHLADIFRGNGAKGFVNSLMMSAGAAVLGTVVAAFAAYAAGRHRSTAGYVMHLCAVILQAVPGLVLGLAFILAFKKSPIYGTLGILILVNTVHFFTIPYTMLYQSFGKLNRNLEDIGTVLGIPPLRLFADVLLPLCKGTLAEMLVYFFVNSMVTISAVSFLATASTRPLSMLIMQYSDQMNPESAAAFSFAILVVNLAAEVIGRRAERRKEG